MSTQNTSEIVFKFPKKSTSVCVGDCNFFGRYSKWILAKLVPHTGLAQLKLKCTCQMAQIQPSLRWVTQCSKIIGL